MLRFLPILFALHLALAQQAGQRPRDVYRAGPGVKAPKLVHKEQARYTREAFNARVQGKVICEVVVDERGAPIFTSVISPIGYGLDESARASISRWKFEPGTKDGLPVKVVTMVEVSFRFPGTWFDSRAERRRTDFNVAVTNLRRRDRNLAEQAAKTIEELARQKYAPALYILARMHFTGGFVEKSPAKALALIEASTEKGYAPAMSHLGMMYFDGKEVPGDTEKGLQLLRDAAVLGSTEAQLFLGSQYEAGHVVPRELDRARRYFRQCAASGHAVCQFRLAKLMFEAPDRKEWEYLQAITWFQLAADRGLEEARQIVEAETPKLTPEQLDWTKKLKSQLLRGR